MEGGNILLALGFKLGFDLGAAFSILQRIREACWLCLAWWWCGGNSDIEPQAWLWTRHSLS